MSNATEVSETFQVSGMTCGHCASAVTAEVSQVPGVKQVSVDVPNGQVHVTSIQPLTTAEIRTAIDEAGYTLV